MDSDKQRLVEAARCSLKWLEIQAKRKGASQRKHKILESICNAVIKSDGERSAFIAKDIYDSEKDHDSGSQANKIFSEFGDILESWAESFNEAAIDNGFKFYLTGKVSKPETVRVLEIDALEVDSTATVAKDKIPKGHIRYSIWERKALPRWQQRLLHRDMGLGTNFLLTTLFLVAPTAIVLFTVYFALGVIYRPSVWLISVFIGLLWAEFLFLKWLNEIWHLYDRKIMILPMILTPPEQPPTALVMRRVKDKRWPVIHAIATSADCLFCDGTVYLREDTHSRYRVIGACNRHPTEHRFTFDHTNNLGRALVD